MARQQGRLGNPALAELEDDVGVGHRLEQTVPPDVRGHIPAHPEGDLELDPRRLISDHLPCATGDNATGPENRRIDHRSLRHLHHLPADDRRSEGLHHPLLNGKPLRVIRGQRRIGARNAGALLARGHQAANDGIEAVL
jgi:hypothetical protein